MNENLKQVLAKIEKSKKIIAAERDELREIYEELEGLLESFDRGIEAIENGKLEIENGINFLSEQI